ncbi:MAG: hypothetical protein OXG24_02425 [Gammaproteobacteria bacterium]|nr:hypothetical protein [Gammaproteobacteria bacterium]
MLQLLRPHVMLICAGSSALLLVSCIGLATLEFEQFDIDENVAQVGHMNFESPHSNPIDYNSHTNLVYVTNTPADTVDVINAETRTIVARINVGIDPVGITIRPDGKEVWVANHVSDSVSVIDSNQESPTYHQVLHTIQVFDLDDYHTLFDEPVGIVFAHNDTAYVALSSSNRIAKIDVATRGISDILNVTAQDPRALAVRDDRLYVIPFESNNQTQISGCYPENLDSDPNCTFDALAHVVNAMDGADQSTSGGYVADIVRDDRIPDRDLYVFDTNAPPFRNEPLQIVDTVGTLLYGIAVDSRHRVYVAQAEARNDANGKAGTEGHGLAEMENRAFLNQITKIDCSGTECTDPIFFELEPLPPDDPAEGMALATPFAIQISEDDATLVVTAAASNRVFTMDATSGAVLGRVEVGAIPRGLSLLSNSDGSPSKAWVLNALQNSVSLVDLEDLANPSLVATIQLEDPSDPMLKLGRILFNDASVSSTETFACASCHPDGHTDQLLWVLETPLCSNGCDQIQPRLVQDIRGLRGSAPYHWDGTVGDPFGGVNTASHNVLLDPNCNIENEESCTLHLIDGSLATTMCDQEDCETNDEGKPGKLSGEERAALAKYLLSVPYPPSVERPFTNELSAQALQGIHEFHYEQQCGNCHRLPFWVNTNIGGSGMDIPSWRGANDRWKNAPQNRFFFADLVENDTQGFPERTGFTSDPDLFQMILEGSVGFSGSFARQVTLNSTTSAETTSSNLLEALETSDREEGVVLQGEGILFDDAESEGNDIEFDYRDGAYVVVGEPSNSYSRSQLLDLAEQELLLATFTARLGDGVTYEHPQPGIWDVGLPVVPLFGGGRPAEFPELVENEPLRLRGSHIYPGSNILVNGRRVDGSVRCETGELPNCRDNIVLVQLDELPEANAMHMLQVQNTHGLFSNDLPFFVLESEFQAESENLISSGGTFNGQGDWNVNLSNGMADVSWTGEANFAIHETAPMQTWRVSLTHTVSVDKNKDYSLCYKAKSEASRYVTVNVDTGPETEDLPGYMSLMGTAFVPEVGGAARGSGASTNEQYREFHHRFVPTQTDTTARIAFNLAQSELDVQIDDVGLYEGKGCGTP